MTYVIFFAVSILASVVGAICGVGGGVFMKPALDAVGVLLSIPLRFYPLVP